MADNIRQVLIDGYPIDIAKLERHAYSSEITSHPVENGSRITDHVRNNPLEIGMECVVSDTPLGSIAQHDTRRVDVSEDETGVARPSIDTYERLKALHAARRPVTIETSLDRFENMILTKLSIPRDSTTTGGLTFEAEFTQIKIVTNKRVIVPSVRKAKQNLGAKTAKEYTVDRRVVWRVGQPPGAPLTVDYAWAVVEFTHPNKDPNPDATKASRVGLQFSGEHSGQVGGFAGARTNGHKAPPFHKHIKEGAALGAALEHWFYLDIERDRKEKELSRRRTLVASGGSGNGARTRVASGGSGLPGGQDMSRFSPPRTQVASGPTPPRRLVNVGPVK